MNRIDKLTDEELKVLDKLHGRGSKIFLCHEYCKHKEYPYMRAYHTLRSFFVDIRLTHSDYDDFWKIIYKKNFEDPFIYELADELGNIRKHLMDIEDNNDRSLWDKDFIGIPHYILKKNHRKWSAKECEFYDSLGKRILEYLEKEQKNENI